MQRVLILGINGAGKSTFAYRLGQVTQLETIHLDKHYWRQGWIRTRTRDWEMKMEKLLAKTNWIIDGNYPSTLDMRLEKADTIIFLDVPRFQALMRVIDRFFINRHNIEKLDRPPGLEEHLSFGLIFKVLTFNRKAWLNKVSHLSNKQVIILQSEAEKDSFLDSITTEENHSY